MKPLKQSPQTIKAVRRKDPTGSPKLTFASIKARCAKTSQRWVSAPTGTNASLRMECINWHSKAMNLSGLTEPRNANLSGNMGCAVTALDANFLTMRPSSSKKEIS